MRDRKKFYRPNFTKNPKIGDIVVLLKYGEIGTIKAKEFESISKFFNISSIFGNSSNSVGNIKTIDKRYNRTIFISPEDLNLIEEYIEVLEVVGSKKNPFNLHEYVDLGLPSGTVWATMNLGASTETSTGNFYKFGETTVYDGSDYNTSNYTKLEDLSLLNDAANVNWGGDWHIPTKNLWQELINNTTHTWIENYNSSGVTVVKFEKTNDSSTFIILPVVGGYSNGEMHNTNTAYYWSNTLHYGSAYYTVLTLNSYFHIDWNTAYGHGNLIRPVCDNISSLGLAEEGDIITYNSTLNKLVVFSFNNWLDLSDEYLAIGLYGIETFNLNDIVEEEVYIINANNKSFIIKSSDYSKVDNRFNITKTLLLLPEYVEIGGIKWATMNVGATSETDYGFYFQWGDTQGYTADQVGSGSGKKYFGWSDYKFNPIGDGSTFTKYNSTDGKTVLDAEDDAVAAAWGSSWRMPTIEEFEALTAATTSSWVTDYQGSGINGRLFTDKTDSSKVLFFPAASGCDNGSLNNVGSRGGCWSSSFSFSSRYVAYGRYFSFYSDSVSLGSNLRYCGRSVRGVLGENL